MFLLSQTYLLLRSDEGNTLVVCCAFGVQMKKKEQKITTGIDIPMIENMRMIIEFISILTKQCSAE